MPEQPVKGKEKWAALQGRRAQLQRKGFSDTDHGTVSEVSDESVAFVFDGGGTVNVPLEDITDLTEEKEDASAKHSPDGTPTGRTHAASVDATEGREAQMARDRDVRRDQKADADEGTVNTRPTSETTPPPGAPQIVEKAVDNEGHVTNTQRLRRESESTDRRQQAAKEDVNVGPVRDPEEKKQRLERATEDEKPFKEWPDTPAHPHQPMEVDKPEHRQQKAVGESIRRPAEAQVGEPVGKVMAREERELKRDERTSEQKAKEKRKGE